MEDDALTALRRLAEDCKPLNPDERFSTRSLKAVAAFKEAASTCGLIDPDEVEEAFNSLPQEEAAAQVLLVIETYDQP